MATVTARRRPSGTSGCPDPCSPRLFSEPSGPETEFCLFPLALAVVVRCAGPSWVAFLSQFQRGLSLHTAARSLRCPPQPPPCSLGLITSSVPVLCCVGGKDWRFWFLLCELYLRTFFFYRRLHGPGRLHPLSVVHFQSTLFQTKGQNLIVPMVSFILCCCPVWATQGTRAPDLTPSVAST